jgi:hypothetical protein
MPEIGHLDEFQEVIDVARPDGGGEPADALMVERRHDHNKRPLWGSRLALHSARLSPERAQQGFVWRQQRGGLMSPRHRKRFAKPPLVAEKFPVREAAGQHDIGARFTP